MSIYIYIYICIWLPADRLPVDWLLMEPPMDVHQLPVGMVAFGSVACRTSWLWLGSMYNCNTIFHIFTYMHVYTHMCICIYVHIYTCVFMYLHGGICIYVYMYRCTCGIYNMLWNLIDLPWNPQTLSVRVLFCDISLIKLCL